MKMEDIQSLVESPTRVDGHDILCPCWRCREPRAIWDPYSRRAAHHLAQAQDILDSGDVEDAREFLHTVFPPENWEVHDMEGTPVLARNVCFSGWKTLTSILEKTTQVWDLDCFSEEEKERLRRFEMLSVKVAVGNLTFCQG